MYELILPINIWDEKRYERMKFVGHNLIFKRWMLSIESGSALGRQCKDIFQNTVGLIIIPFSIVLGILQLMYMLIPKVFIKSAGK